MDLIEIINKIVELNREFEQLKPIKPDHEKRIWNKLRLDWNFHSNHLEGNTLTYGETKVLLETGNAVTGTTKPIRDYDEIRGHDKGIDIVRDLAKNNIPITEAIIRELHKTILPTQYWIPAETIDGKPTKRPIAIGEYKKLPNHVRTAEGKIFKFASPGDVGPMMTELVNDIRGTEIELSNISELLLTAAEFHYKFVIIHPFDDGNGRIARLLLNYFFLKNNYPPIIIKAEDKKSYFATLEASDAGNIESLVIYIGEQLIKSWELLVKGAKGEEIEETEDLDKEIAILEKKLKSEYEEVDHKKSQDVVDNIVKGTVIPLFEYFIQQMQKLNRFYSSVDIILELDNSLIPLSKGTRIMHFKELFASNTVQNKASITYFYNNFKTAGTKIFNSSAKLEIQFAEYKYYLHVDSPHKEIQKLYHQNLSFEETKKIVSEIANSQINYIKSLTVN